MVKKMFLVIFVLQVFTFTLYAEEQDNNPLKKLARGSSNILFSITEIPRQMVKEKKANGDVAGLFWGPLKGICFMLGRMAVGVYELVTFIAPPYEPIIHPEFVFSEPIFSDEEL